MVVEHGYIYAIGYDGEVKLGISATDPKRRLNAMQTGNCRDLVLIAQTYIEGYKSIEKILHRQWKDRHIRGEWYLLGIEEARVIIAGVGPDLIAEEKERRTAEANQMLQSMQNVRVMQNVPTPTARVFSGYEHGDALRNYDKWVEAMRAKDEECGE